MERITQTLTTFTISGGIPYEREQHQEAGKQQTIEMDNKTPVMPLLGFEDREMVDGVPNKEFRLLIIATIAGHDVARVLVDEGSSCDIMYDKLFHNLNLNTESLQPYNGGPLTGFDESPT
jgi:hypothetical protein